MYKKTLLDLVLLDLNMPHIDDFQVMEQLREVERFFNTPILNLITQSDRNIQYNALTAGLVTSLKKSACLKRNANSYFKSAPFTISEKLNKKEFEVMKNTLKSR
jgi:CheY-like chemotaxis protein